MAGSVANVPPAAELSRCCISTLSAGGAVKPSRSRVCSARPDVPRVVGRHVLSRELAPHHEDRRHHDQPAQHRRLPVPHALVGDPLDHRPDGTPRPITAVSMDASVTAAAGVSRRAAAIHDLDDFSVDIDIAEKSSGSPAGGTQGGVNAVAIPSCWGWRDCWCQRDSTGAEPSVRTGRQRRVPVPEPLGQPLLTER